MLEFIPVSKHLFCPDQQVGSCCFHEAIMERWYSVLTMPHTLGSQQVKNMLRHELYMEGKIEDFLKRNSWQVFIDSDISCYQSIIQVKKSPEGSIHTWAASHKCILHNSKRSLFECIFFFFLGIWKSKN